MRFFALLAVLLLAGCVIDAEPRLNTAQNAIRVDVPLEDRASRESRRPFSVTPVPIRVTLTVLDGQGQVSEGFSGWVQLRSEPGQIDGIDYAGESVGPHVRLVNGRAEGLTIEMSRAFSDTRIWAEELGFDPASPNLAACADGLDNDGDGFSDYPTDPGCAFLNDGSEEAGAHIAGVSDILYFRNPSLADVQGRAAESPLDGRRVTVDQGTMIVTQITNDGFYVSEVDESGTVPWSSGFIFSFNTPPRLRACDRIERVSGSVVEFFGFTEINFPSWRSEDWCPTDMVCQRRSGEEVMGGACPIPEPVLLDEARLGSPLMEEVESALVRITDAQFPRFFGPERPEGGGGGVWRFSENASNCDLNGDGDVLLQAGSPEAECNDACQNSASCSEWSQFAEFGQYTVRTRGSVINVVSTDTVPGILPIDNRDVTFASITGTLRHFSPLGPERGYILGPRCEGDFVRTGAPPPIGETCVAPRTAGPDEPM